MGKTKDFSKIVAPRLTRGTTLRLTPFAFSKILYFRDCGPTEVGGYGICGTDDPLLITDVCLIKQECTSVTLEFDEQDSIEFVEKMSDLGLEPWRFSNFFWHTHPGNCPEPSSTDEENFNKNFSHPHWAIFYILAKEGDEYCRLRTNVGPGVEVKLDVEIDYKISFPATDFIAWGKEYKDKVTEAKWGFVGGRTTVKIGHRGTALPEHYGGNNWADEELKEREDAFLEDYEEGNFWDKKEIDDEVEIDIDQNGVVTFWDDETEKYYDYHKPDNNSPNGTFIDCDASIETNRDVIYKPNPEPKWMQEVRVWSTLQREKMEKEGMNVS